LERDARGVGAFISMLSGLWRSRRHRGFGDVVEGERPFSWRDDELADHANYAADVLESGAR
jgi:hypothetical protein